MKRKIIFLLSFFLMAIVLTGCSHEVTQDEITEANKIAKNVIATQDYKLPKEYTFTRDNSQIYIYQIKKDTLFETTYLEYTYSMENAELEKIETMTKNNIILIILLSFCGVCLAIPIIYVCVYMISFMKND